MRMRPIPVTTRARLRAEKKTLARPVPVPTQPEKDYARELEALTLELFEDAEEEIPKTWTAIEIAAALAVLAAKYRNIRARAERIAREMVVDVNEYNIGRFTLGWSLGGFDLRKLVVEEGIQNAMKARVEENVALIQSVPDRFLAELSTVFYERTTGGDTVPDDLTSELQRLYGLSRKRAKFIVRDQVAKANGAMNQIRQQNLGVTEYVWQTAMDERVRPSHAAKHGKVFKWDDPPEDTGHPGHDYNCRCIAIAVIPV